MGGAQIFLKREDLNHTGAHKINNVIGQAMLAKRMGKPRVIAETGAGQHGVATATICARYGLECVVYMGAEDVKRQSPNVYRMKLLGATVVPVESGSKTLKDALNEAMRDWVANVDNTFYIIGTVAGPHPYPMMVRDFQSVIGEECLTQMPAMLAEHEDRRRATRCRGSLRGRWQQCHGHLPPLHPVREHPPDWRGSRRRRAGQRQALRHRCNGASPACCTATAPSSCRTTTARSPKPTASAPAWITPAWAPSTPGCRKSAVPNTWASPTRRRWTPSTTCAVPKASFPPLESSHAVAYAMKLAKTMRPDQSILVNLSGRGDKDIGTVADLSVPTSTAAPAARGQSVKGGRPVKVVSMSRIEATFASAARPRAARR